jgi:hypothetical protein
MGISFHENLDHFNTALTNGCSLAETLPTNWLLVVRAVELVHASLLFGASLEFATAGSSGRSGAQIFSLLS